MNQNHFALPLPLFIAVILLLCLWRPTAAQLRFDEQQLLDPKRYGAEVQASLPVTEVHEYQAFDEEGVLHLRNGLRSSNYVNTAEWLAISEDAEVLSVQLIFSKYPIRKSGYKMNHSLLFKRLRNLFEMDPLLNDAGIHWEIVLQTHCENDAQVAGLFHGVRISYRPYRETMTNVSPSATKEEAREETTELETEDEESHLEHLEELESFKDLPQELVLELVNQDAEQRVETVVDYYEDLINDTTSIEITPSFLEEQEEAVQRFINTYGGNSDDTVTMAVLNRNPHWQNSLVVVDWTGSMYGYGAQALLWHILHFEKSGMDYFTIFNDGDMKSYKEKKIGKTDGVYHQKADNIDKMVHLYNLVMLKGGGGDGPENDLEAILKAIEKYPEHGEVILIADNNSCVRDMELLDQIREPVRVIVCGYNGYSHLNPHYLEIALRTGGSLHTLEMDIYNLHVDVEGKEKDKITLRDTGIEIGEPPCYTKKSVYTKSYFNSKIYSDLDEALKEKGIAANIDFSEQDLAKLPKGITRLKYIRTLNLSHNKINRIRPALYQRKSVENLDLSHNKISELPLELERMKNLVRLDLSHNKIKGMELSFFRLKELKHLDLSNNKIKELPKYFNASYMEYLYLDNNKLSELSGMVARMKKVRELSVKNNRLQKISPRISYMKQLRILDLSNNQLTILPKEIARLKKLERLIIKGNNFSEKEVQKIIEMLPNTLVEHR